MPHARFMLFFIRSIYPWIIVTCGMLFYCFNYFLRVSPSIMQTELSQSFHITATQFGTLASFYYFAYTPMQVPAGILYDKFNIRFVLCFACLIAVVGLSLFISANSYNTASAGRFMIGIGGSFAYIGTLKLASLWLPSNRFATIAGLTTAAGMISGVLSQKYLTTIIQNIGYKAALHSALFMGIILSILILVLIRNRPSYTKIHHSSSAIAVPLRLKQLLTSLKIACRNPQMWLVGLIGCLLYLPSSVFLDLWGIPYLRVTHHLTAIQAAAVSSYIFYGWIISGPIIGIISDQIKRRRMPITIASLIASILLCFIFYSPIPLNMSTLHVLFLLVGFCCGAQTLCFAIGKETNPIAISGTAIAVTNMLIMLGGVIFQPLVGKLLDLHAINIIEPNRLPIYTASDYTFALSVIPIGLILSIFCSLFLKETYCKSIYNNTELELNTKEVHSFKKNTAVSVSTKSVKSYIHH